MLIVYTSNNKDENYVLEAFYEGVTGDKEIKDLDDYRPSEVAVVFGTYKKQVPISYRRGHVVHSQKAIGKDTIILETGYLNRGSGKHRHYAVGLNGLNGRADFKNKNSPADRTSRFRDLVKPWRTEGSHILLCGQVPWDASVDHIDFVKWTDTTAAMIARATTREIKYRPHPLGQTPTPPHAVRSQNHWLQDDLEDCWCCVTFNSNSGVDAALQGIPVIAMDEGSMVMPIANSLGEINSPRTPDRQQWLNDLCYAQWTPAEMDKAWKHLML
jgi:hypothetical protein